MLAPFLVEVAARLAALCPVQILPFLSALQGRLRLGMVGSPCDSQQMLLASRICGRCLLGSHFGKSSSVVLLQGSTRRWTRPPLERKLETGMR